jgi:PAS domain S-box-containing protein
MSTSPGSASSPIATEAAAADRGAPRPGESNQLLTRIVNQSYDAIFLMDRQFRFRYVNDTAVRQLGYSREELLSMDVFGIDPDVTPERMEAIARELDAAGGIAGNIETRHRAKDGRIFPVEVGGTLVEHEERPSF